MSAAVRRRYDHRARELVYDSGSMKVAAMLGMPRSTARSLLRRGVRDVVTLDLVTKREKELQAEVLKLREQRAKMLALTRLLFAFIEVMEVRLDGERLPDGKSKEGLLNAIDRATKVLELKTALAAIGLLASRYGAWRRAEKDCQLDDVSSCPKTTPAKATAAETRLVREIVTAPEYRHIPVSRLAILAQRAGKVLLSASTWSKLIREHGWLRLRERIHPESPKEGIRATRPNEYWHIDVTVIRLLSGRRVHLQAVIDNFSRYILAWAVVPLSEPRQTRDLLREAAKKLPPGTLPPTVVADKGSENDNAEVKALVESETIKLVLGLADVIYSNSMIEAWWRSLKHQWLFLNTLDTQEAVAELVSFYVTQHNTVIPHSALDGLTPHEAYFGTGTDVRAQLAAARLRAQQDRLAANGAASCGACSTDIEVKLESRIPFIPRMVQLHHSQLGMSS